MHDVTGLDKAEHVRVRPETARCAAFLLPGRQRQRRHANVTKGTYWSGKDLDPFSGAYCVTPSGMLTLLTAGDAIQLTNAPRLAHRVVTRTTLPPSSPWMARSTKPSWARSSACLSSQAARNAARQSSGTWYRTALACTGPPEVGDSADLGPTA